MSLTLTVAEIKTLAQFAGLIITADTLTDTDQDDAEIFINDCPVSGLTEEGSNAAMHYDHYAFFWEYPDEGAVGLGTAISEKGGTP